LTTQQVHIITPKVFAFIRTFNKDQPDKRLTIDQVFITTQYSSNFSSSVVIYPSGTIVSNLAIGSDEIESGGVKGNS
jgi:hypothetical protein